MSVENQTTSNQQKEEQKKTLDRYMIYHNGTVPTDALGLYISSLPVYCHSRHQRNNISRSDSAVELSEVSWRMKDRLKTVSVALVVCLNIGVDPPDKVRLKPCANLECWIDPHHMPPQKALEAIGKNLQQQYEFWQPRARYRASLDPTVEEVKKLCTGLRRSAKDERVLLHYNGHGVPRPTFNGEVWVFNKEYTQYIPLSIFDIQAWLGTPAMFVYDCSSAGYMIEAYEKFLQTQEGSAKTDQCIQLAACEFNETLPLNPELPADLFTSCLTTPIEIAIRWFVLQNRMLNIVPLDIAVRIPGRLNDRRTPLGELNWIFTAITDTIAWSSLPRDLFRRLFRQDLMVAGLFRNFLLAERIMKEYNCNPITHPRLPPTHHHPLWDTWDLALDMCLSQMTGVLERQNEYVFSMFFTEQLTGFEKWLERGAKHKAPDQLPIVLQVLLSQAHRLRALLLIGRFLDLGPWAVLEALAVGIFPYVLKLLQSPALELKQVLVYIWARILAVDSQCHQDLLKDNGFMYFVNIVATPGDASNQRAMSLFILAVFSRNFSQGQIVLSKSGVIEACIGCMEHSDPFVRQWACLSLSTVIKDNDETKNRARQLDAIAKIISLLNDQHPEIRACVLYTIGLFLGSHTMTDDQILFEHKMVLSCLVSALDASAFVRKELVILLSRVVYFYYSKFVMTAYELWEEEHTLGKKERKKIEKKMPTTYHHIWKALLVLSVDADWTVKGMSGQVVDEIHRHFVKSSFHSLSNLSSPAGSPGFQRRATSMVFSVPQDDVETRVMNIPLVSTLFEVFCDYFKQPLMTLEVKPENNRNINSLENYSDSATKKLDVQKAMLIHDSSIEKLLFHSFETHLIAIDSKHTVNVWNHQTMNKLSRFSCGTSRISSAVLLNELHDGLLAVGSIDGVVKVYKDYSSMDPWVISGWHALNDLLPCNRTVPGLKLEWIPIHGLMLCGGSSRVIRCWDLEREQCIQDISTGALVDLSCIASDRLGGQLVAAGFVDGQVKLYDRRIESSLVCSFNEHKDSVLSINLQTGGAREMISSSLSGDLCFWDATKRSCIATLHVDSSIDAVAVHDMLPLIACGSSTQFVKVLNTEGQILSTTRYYDGFLGQRISPVQALSFHPLSCLLGVGTVDGVVTLLSDV